VPVRRSSPLREALLGRRPAKTAVRLAVLIIVSFAVFRWVLLPVRTYGDSMLPTYEPGSFHLVNRAAYVWRTPERGDVVGVRLAGWRVMYVKRIVGLPGERIAFRGGTLIVDGRAVAEGYLQRPSSWTTRETRLGPDDYFVAGDNRSMPMEQHEFGRVKRERIVGPLLY
jgi:signal peptidase I